MIVGDETMGYLPIDALEVTEYDAEKDVSHPTPKVGTNIALVPLETGMVAFLDPKDEHRPSAKLRADASKKLIFKIPV